MANMQGGFGGGMEALEVKCLACIRTVYIPLLVASYNIHKGKHWLNSGQQSHIVETGLQSVVQYRICPGITFVMLTILLRF